MKTKKAYRGIKYCCTFIVIEKYQGFFGSNVLSSSFFVRQGSSLLLVPLLQDVGSLLEGFVVLDVAVADKVFA